MSGSGLKRGRPPTSSIPQRIMEGMASNSELKCGFCGRVFPRPKSLRAHENLHTGRKPYVCDYPDCFKGFKQSGHLRCHQFRHSGEKPFRCPIAGCGERYTHSNRYCPVHDPLRKNKLVRDGKEFIDVNESRLSEEQIEWVERYRYKKYQVQKPRGKKRPVENDSDEENIPANKARTPVYENDGFNSTGTVSLSSSSYDKTSEPHSGSSSPHDKTSEPHSGSSSPYDKTSEPHSGSSSPYDKTSEPHSGSSSPHDKTNEPHSESSSPIYEKEHNYTFEWEKMLFGPALDFLLEKLKKNRSLQKVE